MILALVDDLFFSSRIAATAKQAGRAIRIVSGREALLQELESDPEKLIVDLNCRGCDPVALIVEIRQRGRTFPVVGFVSHVQADLAQAAQQAGCDRVVARSYFSSHLAEILGA
ncbi:MAG: response regulator [Acidobacteria bacterium]|nr:response regulator [Acidobacteriota bacterium]